MDKRLLWSQLIVARLGVIYPLTGSCTANKIEKQARHMNLKENGIPFLMQGNVGRRYFLLLAIHQISVHGSLHYAVRVCKWTHTSEVV